MTHLLLTLRGALIYERKPRRGDRQRVREWEIEWGRWLLLLLCVCAKLQAPTVWQATCGKVNCQRACLFLNYVNNYKTERRKKVVGREEEELRNDTTKRQQKIVVNTHAHTHTHMDTHVHAMYLQRKLVDVLVILYSKFSVVCPNLVWCSR